MLDLNFEAIGTVWQITSDDDLDTQAVELAIRERIERFDKDYSRFRGDSQLLHIGQRVGEHVLPVDAQPLLDVYQQLYALTGGAMTPLIGDTLAAAGYDAHYSFTSGIVQSPPLWDKALEYNFPKLRVRQPVILDVGAAGKGYLVDIVAALMQHMGAQNYVLNAGGDILQRSSGQQATEVGLEHPSRTDEVVGVARIINQSICGSSGNRRTWGAYHHIINPHSLQSPTDIAALWVVADTALIADALSTALFFTPPDTLLKSFRFEYAIIGGDLSLQISPDFPATFFE